MTSRIDRQLELAILVGLQASGKTNFYRSELSTTHAHVSKDLLRNNRRPERRQRQLIREHLAARRNVAVDNTNPSREVRAPLIRIGREFRARIVGYYFDASLEGCFERNRRREGPARVPDVALYATRKKLETPTIAEGFDALYLVRSDSPQDYRVHSLESIEGSDPVPKLPKS